MLARSKRLNLKKDFKWVCAGKKIETKFATLYIKTGDNVSPRIGIALSSKRLKQASQRNRAKRLLSQAFQSAYYQLPTAINIVALPKAGVIKVKSNDVLSDLEQALKEAKIL